jgi:hypothetical protein
MLQNRIIMVAGLPSGGTSAVAGMLHHLGVDMGRCRSLDEQRQAAKALSSSRRYMGYECTALYQKFRQQPPMDADAAYVMVRRYIRKRLEVQGRHGFKNNPAVWLGLASHDVESLPIDVLHITRDVEDTFDSDIKYTGYDENRAKLRGLLHMSLHRLVRRVPPQLTLRYSDVVDNPLKAVAETVEAFRLDASWTSMSNAATFLDRERCQCV